MVVLTKSANPIISNLTFMSKLKQFKISKNINVDETLGIFEILFTINIFKYNFESEVNLADI